MKLPKYSVAVASALLPTFLLAACVTINIYFPASAAEKAADKIIDEVWQLRDGTAPATTPAPPTSDNKMEKP